MLRRVEEVDAFHFIGHWKRFDFIYDYYVKRRRNDLIEKHVETEINYSKFNWTVYKKKMLWCVCVWAHIEWIFRTCTWECLYCICVYLNVPHMRISSQVNVKKNGAKPRSSLEECEQINDVQSNANYPSKTKYALAKLLTIAGKRSALPHYSISIYLVTHATITIIKLCRY